MPLTKDAVQSRIRPFVTSGALTVGLMLIISAALWRYVPDRVAVHFGSGGADGYSGRTFALLAVPVTTIGAGLLICLQEVIELRANRRTHSYQVVGVIWLVLLAFLFGIHVFILVNAIVSK